MYADLVYRIGKRYSKEREQTPHVEFPYFCGQISELLSPEVLQALPELQGEYMIAYNDGKGTQHLIRVYFEDGIFEAEGTNERIAGDFSLSSSFGE
jgi:hypothetical protein